MIDYNTPKYCCSCANLKLNMCFQLNCKFFGTPRTRPTKLGQRWLRSCPFYITHNDVSIKWKKQEKLRRKNE